MKIRRLAKNTKALSPVIATIILVAVTVAIAIAVAAWLGALTFTYTQVEQLNVVGATFSGSSVTLSLSNAGTTDVTISRITASGGSGAGALTNAQGSVGTASTTPCTGATVGKGSSCNLLVTFTATGFTGFATGTQYSFTLLSTQGHNFPYTAIP